MIDLEIHGLDQARALLAHIPGGVERATARAINRAANSLKTAAAKKIPEEYYVKSRDVKATLNVKRASAKRPTAELLSKGSRRPLSMFKTSPSNVPRKRLGGPLRAWVKRKSNAQPLKAAFMAKLKGNTAVAERLTGKRLPIRQLYGPAVPQMLGKEENTAYLATKAQQVLEERLEHEVAAIIGGYAK